MPDETPACDLESLCEAAEQCGASDMLLHEGRVPFVRVGGRLVALQAAFLDRSFFEDLWRTTGAGESALDFDASYVSEGGVRFRVNLLTSLGRRGAVFRRIPAQIPELDSLGVPSEILREWAGSRSGLILVCGAAGSGKSTTLAALLDWMNSAYARHVVTIEDPIEFSFMDQQCLFTQREVGIDTPNFGEGLRRALRQNPDVIFIGEIRDAVAATTALQASETGHLVLATLHSATAPEAVERLESLFPPEARDGIRRTLAAQLLGILCQKLLPAVDGHQVLAVEFLSNIGAPTKYIAEGRLPELADAINRGDGQSTRGFLSSLADLVRTGRLSEEIALSAASSPQELQRILRGVVSSSATTRR
ncbi:MAG: PilT/PilU family type 4a pilus ATPase [Terrimicrobiaceae bacterium]